MSLPDYPTPSTKKIIAGVVGCPGLVLASEKLCRQKLFSLGLIHTGISLGLRPLEIPELQIVTSYSMFHISCFGPFICNICTRVQPTSSIPTYILRGKNIEFKP